MKIEIDQSKCCGGGQCVMAAPAVFDQRDEDGVVVLLDASPAEELLPEVLRAAASCPTLAIRVDR
ncbi:ferredoxin [Nocardia sp. ET3-3]|uniref:Ferredoxin n=1 Tax=Nocardia terrae TaxID=2675851 RepID=A0A7K1UPP9_9NOCA|nr:ferredoxin [Nocardia terrae]MVU76149.1 ferredoxin [Nocardia terrae]